MVTLQEISDRIFTKECVFPLEVKGPVSRQEVKAGVRMLYALRITTIQCNGKRASVGHIRDANQANLTPSISGVNTEAYHRAYRQPGHQSTRFPPYLR